MRGGRQRWVGWLACAFAACIALDAGLAHAETRQLVSSASPSVLEPLPNGRALACSRTRCNVFSLADASWTPTDARGVPKTSALSTLLADGSVLVVGGGSTRIWKAASGRWNEAAALPEATFNAQLGVLGDGRVVLVSLLASQVNRLSIYVADADVSAWQRVAQLEQTGANPRVEITPSGVVFAMRQAARLELSHYDVKLNRWQQLASLSDEKNALEFRGTWGETALLSERVAPFAYELRELGDGSVQALPRATPADSVWFEQLRTPTGASVLRLGLGSQQYLWRSRDSVPMALPNFSNHAPMAALDEQHALVSDGLGLWLVAPGDEAPKGRPCDGLQRLLEALPQDASTDGAVYTYRAWFELVSEGCTAQYRRGEAPALAERLRELTSRAELEQRDPARMLSCALRDPVALQQFPLWFADKRSQAPRAACLHRLLDWPNAAVPLERALDAAVTQEAGHWQVDGAVIELSFAENSPTISDRLTPVLHSAAKRHASGFDRLYQGLCRDRNAAAPERQRACEQLKNEHEYGWNQSSKAVPAIIASALVGGAITTAYVARDSDVSRGIATTSGVLSGFALGAAIGGLAVWGGTGQRARVGEAVIVGFGVAGAIGGGVGAYYLSRGAGARAPVTAAGLALPYLVTMVIVLE